MYTIKETINSALNRIKVSQLIIACFIAFLVIVVISILFNTDSEGTTLNVFLYVIILVYLLFNLRGTGASVKLSLKSAFKFNHLKEIVFVVIANLFVTVLLSVMPFSMNILGSDILLNNYVVVGSDIVLTIILAPIVEELVFRGVLLRWLGSRFNIYIAIIVTSLIFGVLHDTGGIFSAIIFGVCMSVLYVKTNNIFVPILAHMFNNIIAEFLAYGYFDSLLNNDFIFGIMCIIGVIFIIILVYYLFKNFKKFKFYLKDFRIES